MLHSSPTCSSSLLPYLCPPKLLLLTLSPPTHLPSARAQAVSPGHGHVDTRLSTLPSSPPFPSSLLINFFAPPDPPPHPLLSTSLHFLQVQAVRDGHRYLDTGLSTLTSLPTFAAPSIFTSSSPLSPSPHLPSAHRLLALGMGIWTLACLGCAASPNFTLMLICRAMVGVGEASFVALAAPFIGEAAFALGDSKIKVERFLGNNKYLWAAFMVGGGEAFFVALAAPFIGEAALSTGCC